MKPNPVITVQLHDLFINMCECYYEIALYDGEPHFGYDLHKVFESPENFGQVLADGAPMAGISDDVMQQMENLTVQDVAFVLVVLHRDQVWGVYRSENISW